MASPYSANEGSHVGAPHSAHGTEVSSPTLVLFLRRFVDVDLVFWE